MHEMMSQKEDGGGRVGENRDIGRVREGGWKDERKDEWKWREEGGRRSGI